VRYKGSGSALEIGCGDGYFLEFLKKKGWGVFGVEPSLYACEYAKKNLGLDVFCGILDDFRAKAGSFDLIYMFEVLEHLHDPFLSLCKIKDMLNNDGVLVITVPNFSGLLRKLFGANWHFIDLPRHLFHFSRKTAQLILEKSGFRILSLESVSDINYLDSTIGYSESIRFWLRKRGFYPPKIIDSDQRKIPSALWKRILHRIEKIIYYPLVKISDMAGIGENLYICAKKK
jgi:SAM-dependent methyltransferase